MSTAGTAAPTAEAVGRTLPRGRHGIPREVVVANQRTRLLWATALEVEERGYAALQVTHITARARVSRLTFYELFADRADCFLAAQRETAVRLGATLAAAYRAEPEWPQGVAAATAALLEFAAASPELVNLVLSATSASAEPRIALQGQANLARLAAALRAAVGEAERERGPAVLEQALVGGAATVIGSRLLAGEAAHLPELHEQLVRVILAPYLGDGEARRIAVAA